MQHEDAGKTPLTGISRLMRHVIWCDMHTELKREVFIIERRDWRCPGSYPSKGGDGRKNIASVRTGSVSGGIVQLAH